jgi:hypothetical protein
VGGASDEAVSVGNNALAAHNNRIDASMYVIAGGFMVSARRLKSFIHFEG